MSLAVCACGKTEESPDAAEPQVVQGEPILENDIKEEDDALELSVETEGADNEDKQESPEVVPESRENSNQGTDSTQKEQPEEQLKTQSASGQFIRVWGSSSDSGLKATQIYIIEVV